MASISVERYIPSSLYEIIAYFGSGCILIVFGLLGMVDQVAIKKAATYVFKLDLHEQIGLTVFVGIIAYAYGQLSSTLSAPIVAVPVSKFVKILGKHSSSDFKADLTDIVKTYGLAEELPPSKVNNKWTLMFYLQVKVPEIGKDIMKRYAREKLARINAFNMLLLTAIAILSNIGKKMGIAKNLGFADVLKPANFWWLVFYIVLTFIYSYEYYKRKCWNNDLLIKVLPVTKTEIPVVKPQ